MLDYLKTVKGLVAGTLITLAALVGGGLQILSWVDANLASASDVKGLKIRVLGVEREIAERKRSDLRKERFQIKNSLELEQRRPTKNEAERLNEIEDELGRVDKRIEVLDLQVKGAGT